MDSLQERLAELADDAPTGGAPPAELWARGTRAHRLRVAALATTVLVVGVVGAGIGVRLVDRDDRARLEPAGTVGFTLPIEYPVDEELPDLGETPGPLAAIWLVSRFGRPPEAVGLVAETGEFGTLPIDLPVEDDPQAPESVQVELSPDGRRVAFPSPTTVLVVHDLVTGEEHSPPPGSDVRVGYTWVDDTHLVGNIASGNDMDGWLWGPGTALRLVNPYPYLQGYGDNHLWENVSGEGPGSCTSTFVANESGRFEVPLCDVLGFIGSEYVLGHGDSSRAPADVVSPEGGNRTVVALDVRDATAYPLGTDAPRRTTAFDDRALWHPVVTPAAPERVTFASDQIARVVAVLSGAS